MKSPSLSYRKLYKIRIFLLKPNIVNILAMAQESFQKIPDRDTSPTANSKNVQQDHRHCIKQSRLPNQYP
jgi:hypothetical protein